VILGTLLSKYSFADVSSLIEELFNFDNIHNLNFLETQVLVTVLYLVSEVPVLAPERQTTWIFTIYGQIFLEMQVLVLVFDLAAESLVFVFEHWVLVLVFAPKVLVLILVLGKRSCFVATFYT